MQWAAMTHRLDEEENPLVSHGPMLCGYLRRILGSQPDADDVYQDMVTRLIGKGPEIAGMANPRAWLLRVAYNAAMDFLRRKQRSVVEAVSQIPEAEAARKSSSIPTTQLDKLDELLRRLTYEERTMLILRRDGFSWQEISTVLTGEESKKEANRLKTAYCRFLPRVLQQARDLGLRPPGAPGE